MVCLVDGDRHMPRPSQKFQKLLSSVEKFPALREREADRLRYEARLAYLDGRTKRAKELNKQADLLGDWR
jgi:hypothetical protein